MPVIKIHYFSDDLPRLQTTKIGDWIDLYCAQDMTLKAGDFVQVQINDAFDYDLIGVEVEADEFTK